MISKHIAGAGLAIVGLIGSLAASAVAPTIDPQSIPAAQRFYLSGSTALDNAIKEYLTLTAGGGICATNTITVFADNALLKSATEYMVTCKSSVVIGALPIGTTILVVKDGTGGSLEGILPLIHVANARTDYFDVDTGGATAFLAACGLVAPAFQAAAWGEAGGVNFPHGDATAGFANCGAGRETAKVTPTNGFADVNAEMFTLGLEAITAADAAAVKGVAVYQQQFGVGVSLNLYRTLQEAQKKAITDAAADMPSLSLQTLRGIFGLNAVSGGALTTDWSQVLDDTGAAAVSTHDADNGNQTVPVAIVPNGQFAIYVCRRGDSSGTQASQDAYFFNNRCAPNLLPFVTPSTAITSCVACTVAQCTALSAKCTSGFLSPLTSPSCIAGGNYTMTPEETGCAYASANNLTDLVFAGNGTGDVDKCLHDHSKHNAYAIGILSGDRPYDDLIAANANAKGGWGGSGDATPPQVSPPQPLNNAASHEWRFIAIDNKKPNLQSVASGIYDDVWDNVTYTGPAGHAQNAHDVDFKTAITTGVHALTQLTVLVDIQQSQTHGLTGGILEPQSTTVLPAFPINLATNPVSALSKAWVAPNQCQPAVNNNSSQGAPLGIANSPSVNPAPAGVPPNL